ncbi:SRPBCC family protein [Microbispora bryophytorum]|uniref:Carbon monoxide dehydrogenase subunit G n=1 Tax=Microbispora bryophytorum TaxID=1460882 RepID=A0A8H9GYT8_9ACTN|nr:carbon monoxide dehydrogenase subunit G [Microbispora bryophytorum]MBD3136838.1 carbon monoxide dehydrogenase subunit G [Microbispora bryophytorum]TQS07116.1 carbon monoxide dehydrogenase subunit G [Microbispora bryophytorum]GGO13085.1 carbon monoxide dehydrogenase subunit G [Microbispora bryophytorum]
MKVSGSALVAAERKRVWDALQDPAVLVRTIPGCERLETIGENVYAMTVTAGVASIKGVYQGEVALREQEEPDRFTLGARGQGAPGTVEATVAVRLGDAGGGTRIDYDAEAVVGGMIGGVGQRMLASVAKKTAGEFFSAVERHLLSVPAGTVETVVAEIAPVAAAGERAAVAAVTGEPRVFTRQVPAAPRPGVPAWTMLAAFGAGAGVALGSAVIGWLLGRQGRRR